MNIYLDIDGVILTKESKPAEKLDMLLEYLTNNHDVYWLTTHCKGDAEHTVNYISHNFKPETIKYLKKIKPTNWQTNKTEAIDFNSDFFWLDDYIFESERKELIKNNKLDSYINVDLKNNPDNLRHFLMVLIERDGKVEKIKKSDIARLVKEAIELIEEQQYDTVSVSTFQRRLTTDYLTASIVVNELFKEKILHDPVLSELNDETVVLSVNKNKVRSLLIN